ncbi:MAG: hypothetical protein KDD64_02530 [Bdellovibrionales bacterium]|nr:hypothetical protein [Bdellovibrionales bacterium]
MGKGSSPAHNQPPSREPISHGDTSGVSRSAKGASLLDQLTTEFRRSYDLIGFEEFLDQVREHPRRFLRNSATYLADAMAAFGVSKTTYLGRPILKFGVQDQPWASTLAEDRGQIFGHEPALYQFYKTLRRFEREPFANDLILARGPVGSGKNRLMRTLVSMAETYSSEFEEGARMRLAFRFPRDGRKGNIAQVLSPETLSNARTTGGSEDFIIPAPLNTNPLFLLPNQRNLRGERTIREQFVESLRKVEDTSSHLGEARELSAEEEVEALLKSPDPRAFNLEYALWGQLDTTSREVIEALMRHYNGDFSAVLKNHICVEKWTMSAREHRGLSEIRPRPLEGARLEHLSPPSYFGQRDLPLELEGSGKDILRSRGAIVEANGGLLAFVDPLRKREHEAAPTDLARLDFLLDLIEEGVIKATSDSFGGPSRIEIIDTVVVFFLNDLDVAVKQRGVAWEALESRSKQINIPYILRPSDEFAMLQPTLEKLLGSERTADPVLLKALTLFTTASRLAVVDSSNTKDKKLQEALGKLKVLEKAMLYDEDGGGFATYQQFDMMRKNGENWTTEQFSRLRRARGEISSWHAFRAGESIYQDYEGGFGVSGRKSKKLLGEIVGNASGSVVTVVDALEYLEKQVKAGRVSFQESATNDEESGEAETRLSLKRASPQDIFEEVQQYAKSHIEKDVKRALGESLPRRGPEPLRRYIQHVAAFCTPGREVPQEFRSSPQQSGRAEERILCDFEDSIIGEKAFKNTKARAEYRRSLWSKFSSASGDYPKNGKAAAIDDLESIFSELAQKYREKVDETRAGVIRELLGNILQVARDGTHLNRLRDSDDESKRTAAANYERSTKTLSEMGYPLEALPKLVRFAFDASFFPDHAR